MTAGAGPQAGEHLRREGLDHGVGPPHFAYRFRHDERPLAEAEGAFVMCGFMVATAEHRRGRTGAAHRWFERHRAACGRAGLYAEEYDVAQREQRGNLPQAFVHALMLEASARLARKEGVRAA
ncbi:glycoside hydrolase family 15 protein [Streptomyces sp. NPDC021224]|uniref:glycoside hydrolase family 15 protein n=1 Tax=unclassified Streptomyces TaxID=2593676 RepID=UPI0037A2AD27